MALFRKFFYRKPPEGFLEISERVFVFDCCFSTDVLEQDDYKVYMEGIVVQLRDHFPDASFMVFNFREGDGQSQIASILSEYDMTVMDYPRHYEGCPLLTMEVIHHFLRSSESWLSLTPTNVLLMHCERGGWPVLAFMLAGLLIYRKQYTGEQRTLDIIYKQAPRELLQLLSPLNPVPSQLRYLHYISRRNVASEWPPLDRALTLDCVILRIIPNFDGEGGCRPIFRIYGQDHFITTDRTPKVLFSPPKKSKLVRLYKQADCELVKIDINCQIQGDVVLECISLEEDLEREEMMFRVMFNTAFIRSNILMLNRDEIDIIWDAKDRFPKDFRAEILFSEMDATASLTTVDLPGVEEKDGLPIEAFAKVQEIFNTVDWLDSKAEVALNVLQHITVSNIIQEKLESVSLHDAVIESLSSPPNHLEKLKPVVSENYSKSENNIKSSMSMAVEKQSMPFVKPSTDLNSAEKKVQPQDLKVSLQRPAQSKIISQRRPQTSVSNPVSSSNSLQGSPAPVSRYHSAPSALGITTLLHDHASYGSAEGTNLRTSPTSPAPSIPTVSHSPKPVRPCDVLNPPPTSPPRPTSMASGNITSATASPPSPHQPSDLEAHSLVIQHPGTSFPCRGRSSVSLPSHPPPSSLGTSSAIANSGPNLACPPPSSQLCATVNNSLSIPFPPPPPRPVTASSTPSTPSPPPPRPSMKPAFSPPPPPPSMEPAFSPPPPPPPPPTKNPAASPAPPPPPMKFPAVSTPPPPPMKGAVTAGPPPPPPPPMKLPAVSTPPPPPMKGAVTAGPPPPPPPPFQSAVVSGSTVTSSAPPPPPPPGFASKSPSTASQNSSHVPPVPPPPAGIQRTGVSPGPPPPSAPFGAKGRGLSRTTNPKNQSKKTSLRPYHWLKLTRAMQGSLWEETQKSGEAAKAPEIDMSELENLFSAAVPNSERGGSTDKSKRASGPKSDKVHLIELRRAYNCEIMLSKVKMPLPDLLSSVLALDDSALDVDQVDNLIKFCPTKEDIELLKGYSGDKENLGKCEQFFLELMKAPRVESKLRVFSFKIQFRTQVSDLRKNLNIVNSAAEEIRGSVKLKRIMQTILQLGNALNQGTARGIDPDAKAWLDTHNSVWKPRPTRTRPSVSSRDSIVSYGSDFQAMFSGFPISGPIVPSISFETGFLVWSKSLRNIDPFPKVTVQAGSAIGFRLDSLLKLTDTRARNSKITLMHYLCKVLADKLPELLDFQKDLVSLEAASKIQLKYLAEEMQAISKGLEKVEQELIVSENDGPVSETFCKTLKEFLVVAEADVRSLASLYSGVGRNADALALYFGEDPARCPFEQVVSTLLNFVRMFERAHVDNSKQIELEKKRAQKEAENEKMKTGAAKKDPERKQVELERNRPQKEAGNEKMETGVAKKEPGRLLRAPIESGNVK